MGRNWQPLERPSSWISTRSDGDALHRQAAIDARLTGVTRPGLGWVVRLSQKSADEAPAYNGLVNAQSELPKLVAEALRPQKRRERRFFVAGTNGISDDMGRKEAKP